jgi:regulator of replication initiation timing
LASQTEAVTQLEAQIGALNTSLETAVTEGRAHRLTIEQLEQAKTMSENQFKETMEALEKLRFDYKESSDNLQAIQLEVSKNTILSVYD